MKILNEDFTAARLAGIPLFCVNRLYRYTGKDYLARHRYYFKFDNNYGASVFEFNDRSFSRGQQYELALLDKKGDLCYDTYITSDVERGDEKRMCELLDKIEQLETPHK